MVEEIINEKVLIPYDEVYRYEQKYGLKEKHEKLLKIITTFDSFCRENGIKYSIADGTLLGAIRHADFIPWDDDADVMVTREEYNKIRKAVKNTQSIRLIKAYFLDRITIDEFADEKLYIDLFINEDMPKSNIVFMWKKFQTRLLRTYFGNTEIQNARHSNFSLIEKVAYNLMQAIGSFLTKIILGKRDIFDLNDKYVKIGKHKCSGIYTRYTSRMYETKRRFDKSKYEAGYKDILFRGKKLMAIKNADTFLHEMYGDYTSMPPEKVRIPEHSNNMLNSPEKCIKRYN